MDTAAGAKSNIQKRRSCHWSYCKSSSNYTHRVARTHNATLLGNTADVLTCLNDSQAVLCLALLGGCYNRSTQPQLYKHFEQKEALLSQLWQK